ncbi:site-2 protease family protein [Hyalangium rubrum]|uniref:Zinc metalloprotease n=1 Tax=Hyalangium rubrum TaxID=3103134 RepID=A0ABU5H073_9BACT|nr:site-2 protease family protein [Hyalangium sp. s54d21]MDY7226851.1 site-2 protease family protein [Hyalangium sp. s54d21]
MGLALEVVMHGGKRWAFQVASFRGIPIRIHVSLLLVLPLLAVVFGGVFRQSAQAAGIQPELMGGPVFLWGLGVAVGLFASVLVHELAHVLYALRTGGEVRSVTLMIVGGVSEISEMPRRHRDEVLMALAGPVTSIGLSALLFVALVLLPQTRSFAPPFFLFYLASLNLILGLFNLVPAFPMDGGRILRGLLAERMGLVRATRVSAFIGKVFAVLFLAVGLFSFNIMLAAIGVFIFMGADSESRQVLLRSVLEKLQVEQLMTPRFHGLEADTPLEEALVQLRHERRLALPLTQEDRPIGWVVLGDVLAVPEAQRSGRTVREFLKPAVTVAPGEDAWSAVRRMVEAQPPLLLVLEQGRLVGTLDGNDINAGLAVQLARAQRGGERSPRWRQERPA